MGHLTRLLKTLRKNKLMILFLFYLMSTWYLVLDGQYNQGGLLHKRSSFYFHTKLHQTGNGKITLEETYQNSSVEIIQRKNKTLFGTNLNLGTGGTEHKGAEIGDKETEESTRLGTNRQERQSHPLEGKTSQDDKRSWRLEDNKSDKQRGEISESLKAHTKKLRNNTYTQDATIPTFTEWLDSGELNCEGESELEVYPKFMRVRNMLLDRKFGSAPSGGENLSSVMGQSEATEFVKMQPGFWQINCRDMSPLYFWGNHHMQNWFVNMEPAKIRLYGDSWSDNGSHDPARNESIKRDGPSAKTRIGQIKTPADAKFHRRFHGKGPSPVGTNNTGLWEEEVLGWTLAVVRIEYANLYHLIQDLYSTFLMMEFFQIPQAETNVLLVEGHPWTPLDSVWQDFFNSTRRLSSLPRRTLFRKLVWSIGSHDNPMNEFGDPELPLAEEFSDLVLSTYGVSSHSHTLNCDKLSILVLLRHDYTAHARNTKGIIKRKFANEKEIITTISSNFPNASVKAVRLELFDFPAQLRMVSETDILVGMHGAGLTHAMFLPRTSGLVEFKPMRHHPESSHFESIAKWRHLPYVRWTNREKKNERSNFRTHIPPEVVVRAMTAMTHKMCRFAKQDS